MLKFSPSAHQPIYPIRELPHTPPHQFHYLLYWVPSKCAYDLKVLEKDNRGLLTSNSSIYSFSFKYRVFSWSLFFQGLTMYLKT